MYSQTDQDLKEMKERRETGRDFHVRKRGFSRVKRKMVEPNQPKKRRALKARPLEERGRPRFRLRAFSE